jgi:hypothetical protein
MMTRYQVLLSAFLSLPALAMAQTQSGVASKGSDPAQSFVSPLGLGTGATIAVTQNGLGITTAIARQMFNPAFNFWQAGFSGTTNTNGQLAVYSSQEADAPGFKAKVGLGKSSFVKYRPVYTFTAGEFRLQAWCRDLVNQANKTLPGAGQIKIESAVTCSNAIAMEQSALKATPPVDDTGKVDSKAQTLDQQILRSLAATANNMTPFVQEDICKTLKSNADFYQFCPDSGKPQKSVEDEHNTYPGLDTYTRDAPSKFEWKFWGSYEPILTSTAYRPVTNGVADLSSKQNWTKLLNTGVGDFAFYYGSLALGLEGGYGQTVQIKTQNVCNNTVSGTFTAQQCSMAMIGKPVPTNAWISSTTVQVSPLPIFGKGSALSSGAQVLFSYVAPTSGGHSSELAAPLYLSPSATRMSFVVGIQPTWDWNTDPKVGNKFSVLVFVGARPTITK